MNKNILVMKKRAEAIKLAKAENGSATTAIASTPVMNKPHKFNPDVMQEFYNVEASYKKKPNLNEMNYTNTIWKGITGEKMNVMPNHKDISDVTMFVCAKDIRETQQILSECQQEIDKRENERIKIEMKLKLIKDQQLENAMKLVDEICYGDSTVDMNEASTFEELKISGTNLSKDVEDYNRLIDELKNF